MKRLSRALVTSSLFISLILPFQTSTAIAAIVSATGPGANPAICNQNVDVTTNVVAYRLSDGDCVIEFKNTGTTIWTPNAGVISARILVVGGGGGGGGRHAGGGGGGGVVEVTNYPISGNVSIQVGSGGAGTSGGNATKGSSGNASRIYSSNEASAGATGITALGGGYGDFYSIANNNIIRAGSGGSGGGTGVPNPFTRDLTAGYTNADPRGLTTQSAQVQKKLDGSVLSSGIAQYGHDGAGGGNQDYWSGGGGGGAGADGSRGGGSGGTSRVGGAGGAGILINITGNNNYYGGGGGGGGGTDGASNFSAGAGGSGGGGAGSIGTANATAGTANTGGGGGGGGLSAAGTNGNGGAGGSGVVIVRYSPDTTAPTFTNSAMFTIAENTSTSTNAATISISESSTIIIVSGIDASAFNIVFSDSVTARIRFNSIPNFEAPTDTGADNAYNITIRATDLTGNFSDLGVTIQVTNVNEPPIISAFSGADTASYTVAENTGALYNIGASDPDAGETITYSLTGTDANDFIISATGTLSFSSAADYENPQDSNKDNVYIVITWASDGTLSDSQTVTITVTNLNEAPTLGLPSVNGPVYKGIPISLTVTVNTPGKVRFYLDGKRIANCLSIPTTGTNPNYVATCNWKPAIMSRHTITAIFTPNDNTFSVGTTAPVTFWILKRTTAR